MQKLRAGLAVVVKRNDKADELMDEIKELYFSNATLHLNDNDRKDFEESKPSFLKFIEED